MVWEGRLTEALEALDADALGTKIIDLGFFPKPIGVAFTSMRPDEVGLHRWDVDVAFDETAVVPQYTLPFILDALPNFVGFFSKPSAKVGQVAVGTSNPDRSYALEICKENAALAEGPASHAGTTASMPAEAFLRLTAGRLSPPHTQPWSAYPASCPSTTSVAPSLATNTSGLGTGTRHTSVAFRAGGRPGLRILPARLGSRPASSRAWRSRNSIWALVLRSSSAAQLARES